MKVSVIIPTKTGRERVLGRTLAAYGMFAPDAQLVIPENYASVGEAWNAGADRAQGDVFLFTTDDCIPHEGFLEPMLETLEPSEDLREGLFEMGSPLPVPVLEYASGGVEAYGSMGGGMKLPAGYDWLRVRTSGVLCAPRVVFDEVGPFADIHYYVDDDWCWRAEKAGYVFVVRDAFRFTHAHQPDRGVIAASGEHREVFLRRAGERRRVAR